MPNAVTFAEVPLVMLAGGAGAVLGAIGGYFFFPNHSVAGAIGGAVAVPLAAATLALWLLPAAR